MFFNKDIELELNTFLNNSALFNLIVLWGEKGNGKTFVINSVLQKYNIKRKNIIFLEDNIIPLDSDNNLFTPYKDEDTIFMEFSDLLEKDFCLFFQNMEFCDLDSQKLIHRLIKYHKKNNMKALVILEYNISETPSDILSLLTKNIIFVGKSDDKCFEDFYQHNFYINDQNKKIFNQILKITNKNIQNVFYTIDILQYMGVLCRNGKLLDINPQSNYMLPPNLLDLYIDLFNQLNDYMRRPLISSAPFSKDIYIKIIQAIYNNFDKIDEYLETLCEQNCLITRNDPTHNKNLKYFYSKYTFAGEYARKAILAQTNSTDVKMIIENYYNHLDRLYKNKQIYNSLSDIDKILLLSKLAKKRQGVLTINQVRYITDLMKYYYQNFMYLNVIEQGEILIQSNILSNVQLNKENHMFWIIYFNALLAVGSYQKVLDYNGEFADCDLNYYIGLAFYYYGNPVKALEVVNSLKHTVGLKGHIHALKASIFDWLGNNKKATEEFKKALRYSNGDLKYQLFKKYSMYIDFRIPECQNKMKEAISYFKTCNLKHYAESLHNYGTGFVFTRNFQCAKEYLTESLKVLDKICANEIYYPLNSLAILCCYNNDYQLAIAFLEKALKCNVHEKFCLLALHNNLFNIAIHIKNKKMAEYQKSLLENLLNVKTYKNKEIVNQDPDIQHQFRQFYYNCALLYKSDGNWENTILNFEKAYATSKYHSNIVYSIRKNLEVLKDIHTKNKSKIIKKYPEPTELEKFIYDHDSYMCEIMFWG